VRWERRSDRGITAPSGVYFYELRTPRERLVGRLVLLN